MTLIFPTVHFCASCFVLISFFPKPEVRSSRLQHYLDSGTSFLCTCDRQTRCSAAKLPDRTPTLTHTLTHTLPHTLTTHSHTHTTHSRTHSHTLYTHTLTHTLHTHTHSRAHTHTLHTHTHTPLNCFVALPSPLQLFAVSCISFLRGQTICSHKQVYTDDTTQSTVREIYFLSQNKGLPVTATQNNRHAIAVCIFTLQFFPELSKALLSLGG